MGQHMPFVLPRVSCHSQTCSPYYPRVLPICDSVLARRSDLETLTSSWVNPTSRPRSRCSLPQSAGYSSTSTPSSSPRGSSLSMMLSDSAYSEPWMWSAAAWPSNTVGLGAELVASSRAARYLVIQAHVFGYCFSSWTSGGIGKSARKSNGHTAGRCQ
ncbi:hypothetical protein T440DRAFT_296530 [Plenodomus tracheiphilus IPT5]|uniref:Uncharacterized protein n=1 Tax=Plenodomus tracheiphilus IPT5 TaxID=1408161 RepID=A0A6A7BHQ9_9PLEO|nr:hypothetical protein T440DRAFT_296530 [Plenodomus tracheiphilus IPT5]